MYVDQLIGSEHSLVWVRISMLANSHGTKVALTPVIRDTIGKKQEAPTCGVEFQETDPEFCHGLLVASQPGPDVLEVLEAGVEPGVPAVHDLDRPRVARVQLLHGQKLTFLGFILSQSVASPCS